mmetsp:Transcript_51109/g.95738  ORF Transcript_51109/g.95738 Transcript_51109/m.95738 type:complete len:305 (+) Transcript_51109:110-1024(+)
MHGRYATLRLLLPLIAVALGKQNRLDAADELIDAPRSLLIRDLAGQPLRGTGTEDVLVCRDTEDDNNQVACFDFSTVRCKAFTPQNCSCNAVLPICLSFSGKSSLAATMREPRYTCCARPEYSLDFNASRGLVATATSLPSKRFLWQANPNSKCFGKGKSTIGDFTLEECKKRCEEDVLRPEDPRAKRNGSSMEGPRVNEVEVCDSIRFQPHTLNASKLEHTGTCSFVYETDVDSCETAVGTLTFFRVNETGLSLPIRHNETTTSAPNFTVVDQMLSQPKPENAFGSNASTIDQILSQDGNGTI